MQPRSESSLLAALAHVACCGLPLLVFAVAAGAIAAIDAAAIFGGVGVLAITGALWWRRACACAPEEGGAAGDAAQEQEQERATTIL